MAEVEGGVPVIVEILKGSRNKYDFDHRTDRVRLDRILFSPVHYPADYGFVSDTLAEDGDPIEALVVLGEPTFPGWLIRTRIVGLLGTTDDQGRDLKLLTVPLTDPTWNHIHSLGQVPAGFLRKVEHVLGANPAALIEPLRARELDVLRLLAGGARTSRWHVTWSWSTDGRASLQDS
jgi:inorganic pyrophosphatase